MIFRQLFCLYLSLSAPFSFFCLCFSLVLRKAEKLLCDYRLLFQEDKKTKIGLFSAFHFTHFAMTGLMGDRNSWKRQHRVEQENTYGKLFLSPMCYFLSVHYGINLHKYSRAIKEAQIVVLKKQKEFSSHKLHFS